MNVLKSLVVVLTVLATVVFVVASIANILAREGSFQPPDRLLSKIGIFREDLHSRSVPVVSAQGIRKCKKGHSEKIRALSDIYIKKASVLQHFKCCKNTRHGRRVIIGFRKTQSYQRFMVVNVRHLSENLHYA